MAEVRLSINGHAYLIACADGEEPRLEQLAAALDGKVSELVARVGQPGEARLMVMAALTLADDLAQAIEERAALGAEVERLRLDLARNEQRSETAADIELATLAARIEAIAARLENP